MIHQFRPKAPATTAATTSRRVNFTARSIARIAPEAGAVDWIDAAAPGLSLRISPGGARTWYCLYKKGRTARRVKLGRWPDMGLADARLHAREKRLRVETEQADPAHERSEQRDILTVGDMAALYLVHARATKRTWRDDGWRLDRYILPAWKSRPVAEIKRGDVHAVLDKIMAAGKPIQANRTQSLISGLMKLAIDRGHATENPCWGMEKRAPERPREVVLSDADLRKLWRALDAQPGDPSDAIRLRLLTGQRGGEVHTIDWADVDLNVRLWTIPTEKTKSKRHAHAVPLSPAALAIFTARHRTKAPGETAVFPNLYHQKKNLRALGAIHGAAYRWHDLRHVVTTRLAALGYPEDLISRILNHAKKGITATTYNQYEYLPEKRAALDAWATELDRIVGER